MRKFQKDPYERDRARNKLSDARNARGDDVKLRERFEKESAVAHMNKKSGKRRVNTAHSLDFSFGDGRSAGVGEKLAALAIALVMSAAMIFLFAF